MTQSIEIKKVLLKRGNTAQSMAYTGPLGEITIDTDLRTIRVHDGVTPGGSIVAGTQETISTAIQNLVGAAPEALDTLAELAAALGNADDTITGLINTLSTKANIADLADVATSGSYDDLTDKPAIPSIAGLATETYVNDAVGGIIIPDVSNFITAEDIPVIPADIADLTDNTNLLGQGCGTASSLTADLDDPATVNTSETLTENNIFVNNNDFVTDIDPELGFVINGWSQRNETEIELNLFVSIPGDLSTFLTGLTVGRTVTVTYSTATGDQVLTSVLSQEFSAVAQFDPVSGWGRVAGRIMGILPEDQTGIVSIDFPVVSTVNHTWTFAANGDLTAPGDITTGLFDVGGRFIQDCEDGTTSMRWINVGQGENSTQLIRAYTGDPKQDTDLERAQIKLNWQGEVEGSEAQSGLTIRSFDRTNPDDTVTHDWQFQGDGNLVLPNGGVIRETVVTDNPTIELEPNGAEDPTQKLIIKGGGPTYSNTANGITLGTNSLTYITNSFADFYVSMDPSSQGQLLYWWVDGTNGAGDRFYPDNGDVTIDEFGQAYFNFEVIDATQPFTVWVAPNLYDGFAGGVQSVVLNEGATADGLHLHLTTGDLTETSIFLGTDDHNVRTRMDGSVELTSYDYDDEYAYRLNFKNNVLSISSDNNPGDEDLYLRSQDDLYLEARGDDVHIRSRDIVRIGTGYDFEDGGANATWFFEEDGSLRLPSGSSENFNRGQIFSDSSNNFINLDVQFDSDILGGMRLGSQGETTPVDIWAGNNGRWRFGADGNLSFPDGTRQATAWNGTSVDLTPGADGLNVNGFIFYDTGTQTISANWSHYYLTNVHVFKSSLPAGFETTVDSTWTLNGIPVVSVQEWTTEPNQWEITLASNYDGAQPVEFSKVISDPYIQFPDASVQTTAWTGSVSYNDLTNKPNLIDSILLSTTLPSGNGSFDINRVGSTVELQYAPADVPTNVSELTNDAGYVAGTNVTNIVTLTQAEYDAITPDASTVYFIVG